MDDEAVFGYVLILFILIVGPLAYACGVDSRIDDRARRDRFPG
jgi:hypothetical protein